MFKTARHYFGIRVSVRNYIHGFSCEILSDINEIYSLFKIIYQSFYLLQSES